MENTIFPAGSEVNAMSVPNTLLVMCYGHQDTLRAVHGTIERTASLAASVDRDALAHFNEAASLVEAAIAKLGAAGAELFAARDRQSPRMAD